MFVPYNPNPVLRQTGDCVVRAISKLTGNDWDTTYLKITAAGFRLKAMPTENFVWETFLKNNGYKKRILADTCPDCYTVLKFCEDHPSGTYLVATGSHVVAIVDGNYFDTWDSGDEVPIYYFERKKAEQWED